MARRQVIVQLDDRMVADLDALAEREGISRSELLRRAATAFLSAARTARLERQQIDSYRRTPQDPLIVETAARLAAESAPPY